ncbi:MAG: lipopolysaccharide heptosyltransferase II [Nitrospiraceae bacterium]|nr:lipopolysaccharide heptosyltransferase II [Nitrospiraceae bacterium]
MGAYRKILIIKPSSLGDVVHSLPFLNSVRQRFPEAEIHWVIAKGLEGLLEGHPLINRLIIINKDSWKRISRAGRTIREFAEMAGMMRAEGYDLAVDLQGLLRSGLITLLSGARERIGFSEAREGSVLCYNRRVRGGADIHAVDRYMKIAGSLGCDSSGIVFSFPRFDDSMPAVVDGEALADTYAVIVPGARWDTKRWPAGRFGKVASMLPFPSVVVGSAADVPLAELVVASSDGKARSLAGRTDLRGLMRVMKHACVVISNDSGPMHIAAGFNVPVVALFGPTSAERTGPYGPRHIVVRGAEPCAPCFRRKCHNLACMRAITTDMVMQAVRQLIA